jgi:outer membrane receptor for ferrienterochelin and colicins
MVSRLPPPPPASRRKSVKCRRIWRSSRRTTFGGTAQTTSRKFSSSSPASNSALFGFNAVAGVINIITYDPLYDAFSAMTGRFGTQSLTEGSAVGTFHVGDNVGVKATAGGYLAHEFSDPYAPPTPLNPTQGFINADSKYRVAPGVIVSLSASSVTPGNIADSNTGSLLQSYYRTNSVSGGISADSPIGALSVLAYRNQLNFDSTADTGSTNFWTNVVYVVQANDLVRLNADHTI